MSEDQLTFGDPEYHKETLFVDEPNLAATLNRLTTLGYKIVTTSKIGSSNVFAVVFDASWVNEETDGSGPKLLNEQS